MQKNVLTRGVSGRVDTVGVSLLLLCLICTPYVATAQQEGADAGAANADAMRRLTRLSTAIEEEGERLRSLRLIGGTTALISGGALTVGGVLLYGECGDDSVSGGVCKIGTIMMGALGAGLLIGGAVTLLWKRGNELSAERYAEALSAPKVTTDLLVIQGEEVLKGMAAQARSDRYWRGGSMVVAGALMGLGALSSGGDEGGSGAVTAGVLSMALISGWGVIDLLWPERVERAWDDYVETHPAKDPSQASFWDGVHVSPVLAVPSQLNSYTGLQMGIVF
jgi:hypothetical protein